MLNFIHAAAIFKFQIEVFFKKVSHVYFFTKYIYFFLNIFSNDVYRAIIMITILLKVLQMISLNVKYLS